MKQRFITSIFIVLATVLAVLSKLLPYTIGDYIFDVFVLAIIVVAGFEICSIMQKTDKNPDRIMVTIYSIFNYAVLMVCFRFFNFYELLITQVVALAIYFIAVLFVETIKSRGLSFKDQLIRALNTLVACIYPVFWLSLIFIINHSSTIVDEKYFSIVFIVMIFLITWLSDTFAYLVGRTFKGPKLAPKISPNKTISGGIGGLLGGIAGAMLIFLLVYNVPALATILDRFSLAWWHFMLIGFFGSVVGQAGDLFESKLKRSAGVKDSGNLFPGHGGMLDRFDAMIFVTSFMTIVISLILIS